MLHLGSIIMVVDHKVSSNCKTLRWIGMWSWFFCVTTVKVYIIGGDGTQKGAWAIHKVWYFSNPFLFLDWSSWFLYGMWDDALEIWCCQAEFIISVLYACLHLVVTKARLQVATFHWYKLSCLSPLRWSTSCQEFVGLVLFIDEFCWGHFQTAGVCKAGFGGGCCRHSKNNW